jgi:chemotaxis protein methyltransferase CheR
VTPDDYQFLCNFLKKQSGLVLSKDKHYLIESRLNPIVREHELGSLSALVARLKGQGNSSLVRQVTEAMTTNESFFYRDKTPFELFEKNMLPQLMKARDQSRRIKIWCAAASSGQEPYSLAMTIKEMGLKAASYRFDILATDLSQDILDKAIKGTYSQFEVQRGLPIQLLLKYFTQCGESWDIAPMIRSMVQYKQLNLLDNFKSLGQFDIVFCRNVLIYFDQETKTSILERIATQLAPDGYMVLGAAETLVGLTRAFKPVEGMRGLYQPAKADMAMKVAG